MAYPICDKPGEFPIYLMSDDEIADPSAVLLNPAPGTMAVTAGFNTIKQVDEEGTWVEFGGGA